MSKTKEMIIVAILVAIFFVIMEENFGDYINYFAKKSCEVLEQNYIKGFLLILIFTFPFNYLMMPGMNIAVI